MSLASGPIEEQVLALERQYWQLPDWRALGTRLVALEQQLAQLWTIWPSAPGSLIADFTGTILGCNSLALAGATVTVNPSGTGTSTWTGTTDASGNYAGSVTIPAPGTSLPLTVTPPDTARLGGGNTTIILDAGSNTIANFTLQAATGYICIAGCVLPLKTTIQVVDSMYGTFTLTYSGTTHQWSTGSKAVNFGGGGGCAASGTNVNYFFVPATGGSVSYTSFSAPCPTQGGVSQTVPLTLVSSTCPGAFRYVYNASGALYGGTTQTLTYTEP